jgi:hypothetical protein
MGLIKKFKPLPRKIPNICHPMKIRLNVGFSIFLNLYAARYFPRPSPLLREYLPYILLVDHQTSPSQTRDMLSQRLKRVLLYIFPKFDANVTCYFRGKSLVPFSSP